MVVTFLPYADIDKSLRTLDKRRLAKQRVEAKQILDIVCGLSEKQGWKNHPATKMWVGHGALLKHYYNRSLAIWSEVGGVNDKLKPVELNDAEKQEIESNKPWWWSWEPLHESHKAALVRKDELHYKELLSGDSKYLSLGYVWPSKVTRDMEFETMFEPINPRQLIPKCLKDGCRNPQKHGSYCGVHKRLDPSFVPKGHGKGV